MPTDFSVASENGISLAVEMGSKIDADVYLLIYNNSQDTSPNEQNFEITNALSDRKKEHLTDLINTFSQQNVKIIPLNYNSNLESSLEKFFSENTVDFILMGINKEEYENMNSAEVFVKMSSVIKCPAITLTRAIEFNHITDIGIVFSTDHIIESNNIRLLKKFEKIFNAKFHLLSVVDPLKTNNSKVITQLSEISEKSRLSLFSVNTVYNKDIIEGIGFFSKKKNIDMAVIMNLKSQNISIDEVIYEVTDKTNCAVFCQY